VPDGLETVADLPKLRAAMAKHGYDAPLIARLCNENWLRVLEKTWGA
jgi:membrane dipeptidase